VDWDGFAETIAEWAIFVARSAGLFVEFSQGILHS
jgi:hypothetical protein